MADHDLWEQFVQENWAPSLESAYGPDWRSAYPEDVAAMLWWAKSQDKHEEKEHTSPELFLTGAPDKATVQSRPNPGLSPITFGSFQPEAMDNEGQGRDVHFQERPKRTSKEMPCSKGREERLVYLPGRGMAEPEEVLVEEELYRPQWSSGLPAVDLNPLLEKLDLETFPRWDLEDFNMHEELVTAFMQGRMTNKHTSSSRQERRKVKRSGGTKRQGEELVTLVASSTEKAPHLQTVEHRIEITGGASTFGGHSRSVPSKQVSGITNEPTFRFPMEHGALNSSSGVFRRYSFTASGDENGGSFKAFGTSGGTQPLRESYPYPTAAPNMFGLLGSGLPSHIDGTPMRDWMMEEAGMCFGMDDPHHPHKKVHKHFSADGCSKVNKSVKKQGRRHSARQSMLSSRVPSNDLHGGTAPLYGERATEEVTDGAGESKNTAGSRQTGQGRSSVAGEKGRARDPGLGAALPTAPFAISAEAFGKPGRAGRSSGSTGRQVNPTDAVAAAQPLPSNPGIRQVFDRADVHGRCPLHVAAMAGRVDVVEQLLQHGCDPTVVLPVDLLNAHPGRAHPREYQSLWMSSTADLYRETAEARFSEKAIRDRADRSHHTEEPWRSSEEKGLALERSHQIESLSLKHCNALHLAAYYGHITVVEILLTTAELDPWAKNDQGCTALHFAASRGHKHIVTRLLKTPDCQIDVTDLNGRTALHHAAAKGRSHVIGILWPKGCKIDAVDTTGWTALHYAAFGGYIDAVGDLIIAGCPVSKCDNDGLTPGHIAAYKGYGAVLGKLLHAGFYHDMQGDESTLLSGGGSTALHMAATMGHAEVIKQLLAEGANFHKEDGRGFTPLQCAAKGGYLEAFTLLLEAGCNPMSADSRGRTLLHSAATGGNWDIVRKLMELGCDPAVRTDFGETALYLAALSEAAGATRVVMELLKRDCTIFVADHRGSTPWHAAAESGNLEVMEMFLRGGCDIEVQNKAGMTALHCAAAAGRRTVVKALIERGVNLRALTSNHQTALHLAAENLREGVLEMLVRAVDAAVVNLKDYKGNTVLHYISKSRVLAVVMTLGEEKADVNAVNNYGQTPMHIATIGHSKPIVEVLLKNGCDPSVRDKDGCTALHYAAQQNDADIFSLLFPVKGCNVADKDKRGFGLLHYAVEGGNPDIVGNLLFRGAAQYDQVHGSENVMNALHVACQLGHVSVASYLIKAGYSVRGKGPNGLEPIHYASGARGSELRRLTARRCAPRGKVTSPWSMDETEQHNVIVDMLLEKKADIHVVDKTGCNALMYAAGAGGFELVVRFLEMKVDAGLKDDMNRTAMHYAANSGRENIISLLLKAGVAVDACDRKGQLPLHRAAERGELRAVCSFVENMVKKNADIHQKDADGFSPVQLAAAEGYVDVVTKLLEGAKEQDVKGLTGLHLGIQMKMEDIVKSLLKSGNCDVNARDAEMCTPLHYAAETGQQELVELLLKVGADMFVTSNDGMMPLHRAAAEGHSTVVEKLMEHGALRNYYTTSGSTPLHYAAAGGKLSVIQRLIEKGIPVNQMSNGSGMCTALYSAASNGSLPAVNMLLDFRAEVDTICTNEYTALHIAASNGHPAVVKRLIEAGAEVDFQATNSISPIHNAVNNGHYETTEVLISADCDLDIQNSAGNTPLHIAACKGNLDLVKLLLGANCDIHIKNAKGHQAIHCAASNGFFDVVLLLVQHGAPWRQKGDLDVAKMLCRKSNYMASYVDGRLRIAERAKHRKAKPAESSESIPSAEELKQKQAQADAIMLELLAEEEKEKQKGNQGTESKGKKKSDRRRKNQSVGEGRKEPPPKVSKSPVPSEKAEESEKVEEGGDEAFLEAFPRVIMRGKERRQLESSATLFPEFKAKSIPIVTESRSKRREQQNKPKKNRQPAPRLEAEPLPRLAKLQEDSESSCGRKTPPQSAPETTDLPVQAKNRGSTVTVIRRRSSAQPPVVRASTDAKKPSAAQTNAASGEKEGRKTAARLSRSVSLPDSKGADKTPVRSTPHRSLTMAAVVAGQSTPAKKPTTSAPQTDLPAPSPVKKSESSHVWADAVKSSLEKKAPEPKAAEAPKPSVLRKKSAKLQRQDSEIRVVNVSSNKRAFLPFAESPVAAVHEKAPNGTSKILSPPVCPAEGTGEAVTSEGTPEASAEEKDSGNGGDENGAKEPVLKWVTKELPANASDLKGKRMTPLTHKMKKLSLKEEPPEEETEEKGPPQKLWTAGRSQSSEAKIESPWRKVKSEGTCPDATGFPPLVVNTSVPPLPASREMALPTGFPFPGGSAEWSGRKQEPPEPPAVTPSRSWEVPQITDVESGTGPPRVLESYEEATLGFGDPTGLMYSQLDPDSLLPPELKEEIANGGATSNHFRTKNSVSSGQTSPTPVQSPSTKPSPSTPAIPSWSINHQGPFFQSNALLPPPPPSQSSTILSRIPDDPWEIDAVESAPIKQPLVVAQPPPPPPEMHAYEDRGYLCPVSRRPIANPYIVPDGTAYDQTSLQTNAAYYHPYISYSNGYL